MELVQLMLKQAVEGSEKLNSDSLHPEIYSCIDSQKIKTLTYKHTMLMFIAAPFITAESWKQAQ